MAAVGVIAMTTGFMIMAVTGPAQADDKVNICHRTDNDQNPYTLQRVSKSSTAYEGHLDHLAENGGGEDKFWHSDGVWNGIPHLEGDFKPDYIEGVSVGVPSGAEAGRAFCRALTVIDDIKVIPAITVTDLCGTASDSVTGVPNAGYTFVVSGNTVTFTAAEDYVLDGPSVLTAEFTNVPCPVTPTPVTPAITVTDLCGTANDSVTGVANVGYTFVVSGNTVTFTAAKDYELEGASVLTAQFTDEPCATNPPPPVVAPVDVCPNIEGVQSAVPEGLTKDSEGNCVEPKPKPEPEPEVAGTEAPKPTEAVPTAVAAGLPGGPTFTSSSSTDLLAKSIVSAGLALLMAAGWLQIGRRSRGVHQV